MPAREVGLVGLACAFLAGERSVEPTSDSCVVRSQPQASAIGTTRNRSIMGRFRPETPPHPHRSVTYQGGGV